MGDIGRDSSDSQVLASHREVAHCDTDHYLSRTARNHYWLGGDRGQLRIRDLSIGVAGLGGMGSNIAELLVRLGVGHLRIADPDCIETTNLNRQVIANQETIGLSKVEAAVRDLRRIARDYSLLGYDQGITPDTVGEFVHGCSAIVDEIDVSRLDCHVLLHRAARRAGLPLYSAYMVGMGVHFYKFQGDAYTFEDLLDCDPSHWNQPTSEFLVDRFGQPLPSYLKGDILSGYLDEIREERVPIFGPSTLLGQGLLVTRMVADMLGYSSNGPLTPTMPEFLVLDAVDLTFTTARVRN